MSDNLPDVTAISDALDSLDGAISFIEMDRGLSSDPPSPDWLILARARTALESLSARVTQAEEVEWQEWEYMTVLDGYGVPPGTKMRRTKAVLAGPWRPVPIEEEKSR